METAQVKRLLSNHGCTTDDEARILLQKIKLLKMTHKEIGSKYGYYSLDQNTLDEIMSNPSHIYIFSAKPDEYQEFAENAKETIDFIFEKEATFLMPCIINVFDQMNDDQKSKIIAVCIDHHSYDYLKDEDFVSYGYYVMKAILFY